MSGDVTLVGAQSFGAPQEAVDSASLSGVQDIEALWEIDDAAEL